MRGDTEFINCRFPSQAHKRCTCASSEQSNNVPNKPIRYAHAYWGHYVFKGAECACAHQAHEACARTSSTRSVPAHMKHAKCACAHQAHEVRMRASSALAVCANVKSTKCARARCARQVYPHDVSACTSIAQCVCSPQAHELCMCSSST